MTPNNLIIIKGGAYLDIKKALKQWIDIYLEKLQEDFVFKLFKNGRGKHIILADERLENNLFYFLVNHLDCPEGIDYKIDIEGFTTGKEDNILKDKKLLVYISSTDKDGDNVFVTTSENENFKVDFGGKIKETSEVKIYNPPMDLTFINPEIIKVDKAEFRQKQKEEAERLKNKFKIYLVILMLLFLSTYFILFILQDKKLFLGSTAILNIAFIGCYNQIYRFDDSLLKESTYYWHFFGLSVLWGIYGIILSNIFDSYAMFWAIFGLLPLSMLILLKIGRALKTLVKSELKKSDAQNEEFRSRL